MLILRDKNLNKYKYFSFIRRDLNESLCGIELLNNIIYEETISSLVKSISDPKNHFTYMKINHGVFPQIALV